jgi:hypothetical protein
MYYYIDSSKDGNSCFLCHIELQSVHSVFVESCNTVLKETTD